MKVSFSDYIKKLDASVLVAMAVFKGLNNKHLSRPLAEVSETTSGGTPLRNHPEYYNGDIAWIKSGELNDGFITKAEETISELGLKNSSAKLFPKGTLLVAMYGATTGKVGILEIPATTNQAVCAVMPKPELDRDFLYWFLRQHRYEFISISKGGAQPNISQTLINRTEIPLPPIHEQKNIAELLSEIEINKTVNGNLIDEEVRKDFETFLSIKGNSNQISAELDHQLALVKELRQAYLREAMQGKLVPQDPTDEPAEILLEKIKAEKEKLVAEKRIKRDKPLPPLNPDETPFEIPTNWTWCRLIEISELKSGNQYKHTLAKAGVMYVKVGDMNLEGNEYEIKTSSNYFDRNEVKERDLIPLGSIIFPKRGGAIATNKRRVVSAEPILVDSNTMAVTPSTLMDFGYFLHWFNTIDLSQTGNVNIIPQVNNKDLEPLLLPLPPLAEQERIVAKLEKLMKFCDELEANIKQGITNADRLLQTALREALEPRVDQSKHIGHG